MGVVYLLIPTSNHNSNRRWYIKSLVVYLLIPTSNHNREGRYILRLQVVYLLIPTSNHNSDQFYLLGVWVVYLLIPTSNHNYKVPSCANRELYIFWFLHQTTTFSSLAMPNCCCISFDSYIKPQHYSRRTRSHRVVYLLIPTSNHNHSCQVLLVRRVVYLLIPTSNHNLWSTLIISQQVVYLLIPTSNHNKCIQVFFIALLYIFWFLHQTTTIAVRCFLSDGCISFDSYIKPQLWFSLCCT